MKKSNLVLALFLTASPAWPALRSQDAPHVFGGYVGTPGPNSIEHTSYPFQMEIVSDDSGEKTERFDNGTPSIEARPGERYSVRLYNPMPVRVAVNLTVDGLNSISGKPCGISDGPKWIIEPGSSITIPGWQVNGSEARRFFFTKKTRSYAAWREQETGRRLTRNCGVIGAAFFWNRSELDAYFRSQNAWRDERMMNSATEGYGGRRDAALAAPAEPEAAPKAKQEAGTGMGERRTNPTVDVAFHYDSGMYRPEQALVVYYDFPEPVRSPNPFPGTAYAPELPSGW
jgi:hypothetical protein